MSQESRPAGDNAGQKPERPQWVSQLVFPMIVAVLGAVLITALTPLGASLRELLFHTRATVTGSVAVDDKPAAGVHLKLDGVDWGNTDVDGRFLLTGVSKGQHRLHLELLGATPRDEMFYVASGQTALQVGNLEMKPLVRLAYRPVIYPSGQQLDYDITLWVIGDPDVLNRIKSVSYTLPTPLSSRPVSGTSAGHAFCYRQTGSLPPSFGYSAPVLALAIIDLGGGQKFQISGPASTAQPPDCPAQQAGSASPANTTPAVSQQPSPSPRQSGSFAASPTPPLTEVPDVIGYSVQTAQSVLTTAGFTVSIEQGAAPAGESVAIGTVWKQDPSAGPAERGSTVTIFVQNQQPPTPSPTPAPSQ